jgi:hypothetical protein
VSPTTIPSNDMQAVLEEIWQSPSFSLTWLYINRLAVLIVERSAAIDTTLEDNTTSFIHFHPSPQQISRFFMNVIATYTEEDKVPSKARNPYIGFQNIQMSIYVEKRLPWPGSASASSYWNRLTKLKRHSLYVDIGIVLSFIHRYFFRRDDGALLSSSRHRMRDFQSQTPLDWSEHANFACYYVIYHLSRCKFAICSAQHDGRTSSSNGTQPHTSSQK